MVGFTKIYSRSNVALNFSSLADLSFMDDFSVRDPQPSVCAAGFSGGCRMDGIFHKCIFGNLLPAFPLLAGIHLTLLAHFFTAFQQARTVHAKGEGAIEDAYRQVFTSCVYATLTTVVGLLSLALSDVRPVREFGIISAVGVAIAFAMTFGPGLAFLALLARRKPNVESGQALAVDDKERSWPTRLTRTVEHRSVLIFSVALTGVLVAAFGFTQVRTDIRAVEFLNRRSPTRQALQQLDVVYGGINVVQLEIDSGRDNGINDLEFLRFVQSVHDYAATQAKVSGVYSYSQLLAMINQIWEGDQALRLPQSPLVINLFVVALRAYNFPFLTALADAKHRTAYIVVRTPDMASKAYLQLLQNIRSFADLKKPPSAKVSVAAGIHSILEADRRILRSQLKSALSTLLIIGLVLALLWRSITLSVIVLVANTIPVGMVIAAAGFADIPLNSITVMVAAITLGLAVDDSIHFITEWIEQRRGGKTPIEAVHAAFRTKLRPILFTSVILVCLFSLFSISSFPPVMHFGLLSAAALAGALVSVLLLVPAMLCFAPGIKKLS
jgi:uncharacterized protein